MAKEKDYSNSINSHIRILAHLSNTRIYSNINLYSNLIVNIYPNCDDEAKQSILNIISTIDTNILKHHPEEYSRLSILAEAYPVKEIKDSLKLKIK